MIKLTHKYLSSYDMHISTHNHGLIGCINVDERSAMSVNTRLCVVYWAALATYGFYDLMTKVIRGDNMRLPLLHLHSISNNQTHM